VAKPFSPILRQSVRALLLASAVAGVGTLVGCEDSITGKATKDAMTNTEKSIRAAASAGDARPAQKLLDDAAGSMDPVVMNARIKGLLGQAAAQPDTLLTNVPPATMPADSPEYHQQLQKLYDDDLVRAQKLVAEVKALPGMPDQAKILLETQSGYNELAQVHQALLEMEGRLQALEQAATALQGSAMEVATVAKNIEIRTAARNVGMDKLSTALTEAQAAADKTRQDADEKDHLAKSFESQVNSTRQEAADLERQALTAMQAASRMRGQASMDAFDAAVKVRAQAATLAKELAIKLPQLSAQQHDAVLAAVKAQEAADRLKNAQATKESATKLQEVSDKEIANLQAQIKHLVTEGEAPPADAPKTDAPSTALAQQYARYAKLRDELDGRIDDVTKTATSARGHLERAVAGTSAYASALQANDPKEETLLKAARQTDVRSLLASEKAAASFAAAEAQLLGYRAALLEKALAPNLGEALKAGGVESALAPDIDKKVEEYRQKAYTELHERAVKDCDDAEKAAASAKVGKGQPTKWVALNIKAAVWQACALVGAAEDDRTKAYQAAKTAMDEATALNPSLSFPGMQAPPAPAPAPAEPAPAAPEPAPAAPAATTPAATAPAP